MELFILRTASSHFGRWTTGGLVPIAFEPIFGRLEWEFEPNTGNVHLRNVGYEAAFIGSRLRNKNLSAQ